MNNRFLAVIVFGLIFSLNLRGEEKKHPFLFTTQDDIQRAKKAVKLDRDFAKMAADLISRAQRIDSDNLPELDFNWVYKSENVKNVSLHTYHKPRPWALAAQSCARASVFRPELAAKAKDLLLHLSNYKFASPPMTDALNNARVAYPAMDAYDIIYDTLSDEERAKIDDYFTRLLAVVIEDDNRWLETNPGGVPVNNHVCWHKLCIGMYGLFYDKPAMVNDAVYSKHGMEFMLNFGFRDDGLWGEASIAYCLVALEPMLLMAEILENTDSPVSLYEPTADGRDLKQAYDSFFQLILPDGYFPKVADTYGKRPKFSAGMPYEILYNRFGDEKYAWLINRQEKRDPSALFYGKIKVPDVEDINMKSVLLPEQGYAFLRTNEGPDYWNGKDWTLMASYSDVYVHRHLDKLSIRLFGDGHLWLTDPGMRFVENGINWEVVKGLNRHTISHNTVMVDYGVQNDLTRRLELVEYSSLPQVKRITMADYTGRLYPGVKQMRTCIVKNDYVLDLFQLVSEQKHQFAFISHVSGESEVCSVKDYEPYDFPESLPWIHLKSPRKSISKVYNFTEVFSKGQSGFGIDVFFDKPASVIKFQYSLDDSSKPQTEAGRIFEINDKTALFAAVYRTKGIDAPVSLNIEPAEMNNYVFKLEIGDNKYIHRLPQLLMSESTPE